MLIMLMRLQKNFLVAILLAAVLCVMELGLLTHAVSHIQDYTSNNSPSNQDKNTAAEHCQQCLSYAQADTALVMPVLVLPLDTTPQSVTKIPLATLVSVLSPTYRARAPPSFA